MIRRLFNFGSRISLLLCIGMAALWTRSYRVGDALGKSTPARDIEIISRGGELMYYDQINPPELSSRFPSDPGASPARWSYGASDTLPRPDTDDQTWLNRRGISIEWRERSPAMGVFSAKPLYESITRIVVPHWLVAIALAVLPTIWLAIRLRDRRLRRSCCPSCGYDLRGSSGRCPECGTPIALNEGS